MDPVSAIGLASAIITFIEFGSKLLKGAKEIRDSANDSLEKNESREVIAEAMKEVATKLKTPEPAQISPEQQKLCDLAVKCNDLSQRILELLNKIKPKNKKPLHVYRAAFHAWRKEDDIKDLEKRLSDCRNQLALSLSHLASKSSAESSDRIIAMVQEDSSKLEQLQIHIKQLQKGVEAQTIGEEALEQLRLVLGIHDKALSAIYQDRILRSLQFEDMHRRDDRVQDPYENTFKWILEDAPSSKSSRLGGYLGYLSRQDKKRSRELFLTWLSSGSGIFHVSGKLGSGKSTLMRYLSTHTRNRIEVKKWAGDRTLVMANFFFWKPGSELQKSLEGLFRSLLWDILKTCPNLIRDTLPEYWRLAEQAPWQIQTRFNIPSSTVSSALQNVISDVRLYQSHRFCFFIDGLDEYEGTDRQDPTHLVTLLQSWVKESHGCLKLCVSSREHNVFMNAFPKDQRLRLHELTLSDMQEYVAGHLKDMQSDTLSEHLRNHLITSIPEKADGIFLWTILVVRTIRRKIEDREPEGRLIKLLDSLPQGLSSILQRILEDLDADNRRRLYQTIAMLRVAKTHSLRFTLLAFSFLDDYEKDTEFSIKGHIPTERKKELVLRWLRGACGGLVEARVWSFGEVNRWETLEYTHRSVPDMFDEGALKHEMNGFLEGFNAAKAILHLNFAEIQFIGNSNMTQRSWWDLANMLLTNEIEDAPYPLLERLRSWSESGSQQLEPGYELSIRLAYGSNLNLGYLTSDELVSEPHGRLVYHSMLCLAGYCQCLNYIKWRIEQAPKAMNSSLETAMLAHMVLHIVRGNFWTNDFFFDAGVFTDLTATGFIPIWTDRGPVKAGNLTIWQRFLSFEFLDWSLAKFRKDKGWERSGQIIQRFLEHGASHHFFIEVEHDEPDGGFKITFSFEATEVIVGRRRRNGTLAISRGFSKMLGQSRAASRHTFQDWIRASNYPNGNRILELLGDDGEEAGVTGDDEAQDASSEP
ncbi:NACHT domain-containing protein [Fusarium sp. LHS14.1]|nr:NACHT domain-containing protein [Fusarium sp. LHS14.1]